MTWTHTPSLGLQAAGLCVYNVIAREIGVRGHFYAVRSLYEEHARMERVIGLLLPPSIIPQLRAGASQKGVHPRRDEVLDASVDIVSTGDAQSDSALLLSVRNERFAENFMDASVMFAEGAPGLQRESRRPK